MTSSLSVESPSYELFPERMLTLKSYSATNFTHCDTSAVVRGKTIALLGLAFKPNTDDMRDAPSIAIVQALKDAGAHIRAFDPKAMEQARSMDLSVEFAAGEEMRTEISSKFTYEKLCRVYEESGLAISGWFTDKDCDYALSLARPL